MTKPPVMPEPIKTAVSKLKSAQMCNPNAVQHLIEEALAALQSAQPAEVSDAKWEGAEEWMPLAWELCADECGEEACTELVWEGGPIPEPWGDRWLKYEDEAKRLIELVRKHVPTLRPAQQATPEPEWLHLKPYGYAPGNYSNKCIRCSTMVEGVDKRAYICRPCALTAAQPAQAAQVLEGSTQEAMTAKWCWWLGDGERFQIVDTESEAHGEAQSGIDDDCDPGQTHQYSIARMQHPIDALGMGWLAEHVAESIAENACCWCDDNTGAEEPSIMLSADDKKALGTMVAGFLRQRVGVYWWTADQKTVRLHTYVSGSNDDTPDATAAQQGDEHG